MLQGNLFARRLSSLILWPTLFLILCLGLGHAWGKPPAAEPWSGLAQVSFVHHPVTAANVFIQDRSGFIWMGTQSGLVRWDGYRMRRYAPDPANPHALRDGFVLSLHVDRAGRLWIGTSSGGLARYEPDTDGFVAYPAGPDGVGNVSVSALADDGAGGLWIGTGAGLDHMSAAGGLSKGGAAGTLPAGALPEGGIDAMLLDRKGNLWIGTRKGLFRRDGGRGAPRTVALGSTAGSTAFSVNALFQDSAGRIWIGTRNNGAFVIDANADLARAVEESGERSELQRQRVFSFVEVAADEIWIGTEGAGIVAVHPGTGGTRRIRRQLGVPDSLPDHDVRALYRERGGLVFVATPDAMSLYDPHPRAILTVREAGYAAGGSMSIPSILVRPDGRLWLGVAGGGINIVDPVTGPVAHLLPGQPRADASLPSGRVIAMANGPDGQVYIGTQQGLYRSDGRPGAVERLEIAERPPGNSVWAAVFQGSDLWFGGLDGIWKVALTPGQPPRLLRHESSSLGDPRVMALLAAPDGTLWIGTRAGLARLDGATGEVQRVSDERVGALQGYVSSLLIDRQGRLWVSNFGAGVAVLEGRDAQGRPRFRQFGVAEGLPHAGANALREDAQGFIWVSTDDGLARIDPTTFDVRALGSAEGVKISSYWTDSSAVGPGGELLFGGASGLTVVRSERLTEWTYRPPLVVTAVTVNDAPVPAPPFNQQRAGTERRAMIRIAPEARERGFAVEFSALDYSAPERNRYAYRLVGFDKDWIGTDASLRRVSYNNLPPGDYTLQLRGSNRDGAWSPPLEVAVRAEPSWYQRTPVRLLGALGIVGLLAGLLHARTAYLRRRQRELQQMVEQRTAELQASQRQLETMAYSDPLTGLPNRRRFTDELRHMGARALRERHTFTLLLIDLDHFKGINDTLGHDAGDALLVEVANRMRQAVRQSDRLARLGGDEFAVLLSNTGDAATIGVFCQRIVAAMAEPIRFGEHVMRVSASIGAATFSVPGIDLDELYKQADLALYATKARGRNGWSLYGTDQVPVGQPA